MAASLVRGCPGSMSAGSSGTRACGRSARPRPPHKIAAQHDKDGSDDRQQQSLERPWLKCERTPVRDRSQIRSERTGFDASFRWVWTHALVGTARPSWPSQASVTLVCRTGAVLRAEHGEETLPTGMSATAVVAGEPIHTPQARTPGVSGACRERDPRVTKASACPNIGGKPDMQTRRGWFFC
jgi:hypothetical protein